MNSDSKVSGKKIVNTNHSRKQTFQMACYWKLDEIKHQVSIFYN